MQIRVSKRQSETHVLCSAPAERSGDGAFGSVGTFDASQSGVALRLPPRYKISMGNPRSLG